MNDAPPPVDPGSVLRSKGYHVLIVLAAVLGAVVSLAAWGFLELVHEIQQWVFTDLPDALGFDAVPSWWPLPVLALAGLITAFAIERLPGRGGHVPADGLSTGGRPTQPIELPGVMLAALATLGLGLVLGPEAPLIALGAGLGILAVRLARKDAPNQALSIMAAAGSVAAISTIFGSPVIGAVVIIEAAGLGGPTLPLVLLPALLAGGVGSLIFIGMGSWTGLSTSAYALDPLALPAFSRPDLAEFGWTVLLAVAAAVVTFAIIEVARMSQRVVSTRPFLLIPAAALVVAGLAIAYSQSTGEPTDAVLFSGQDAFGPLVNEASTLSLSTLGLLFLFKGLAWSISLGNFRGGPTFPALFLGVVGGLLAADLPGFSETPAVAVLMGAMCVSMLKLPLSSIVIALLLTYPAGLGTSPLIIVAVVIAYLTINRLSVVRARFRRPAPAAVGNE
jgi:chloride channel protein, CIC family